jgi:hypothetical protein
MDTQVTDFHVEYPSIMRHWSPVSEKYAGADCLVTAVQNGWRVMGDIYREDFWHAGTRLTTVLHITLRRGNESMIMPVISNPYARRLIFQNNITPRPIQERTRKIGQSEV